MLVRIARVGNGNKWHIVRSLTFTYCGAKPDWIGDFELEMSKLQYLCANCKREVLRKR